MKTSDFNETEKKIISTLDWFASKASEPIQYNWSADFSISELKESNSYMLKELSEIIGDWKDINIDTAEILGFRKWSDEENLYLIPLYLFPIIPIGLEVKSILGNIVVNDGTNIDNDNRAGLLAYGIIINE